MKRLKNTICSAAVCAALLLAASCAQQPPGEPMLPPAPDTTSRQSSPPQQPEETSGESGSQIEIKLYLNGNRLELETPPVLQDGSVMVPLAEICGYFSRSIQTSLSGEVLTVSDSDRAAEITITAGSATAVVNGKNVTMPAPALLSGTGEMLVELSCYRPLFDADNKYNEEFQAAYITESGLC